VLFHVLEHYVDQTMRDAGRLDLLTGMRQWRARMRRDR
jgi:hypothetical protein